MPMPYGWRVIFRRLFGRGHGLSYVKAAIAGLLMPRDDSARQSFLLSMRSIGAAAKSPPMRHVVGFFQL